MPEPHGESLPHRIDQGSGISPDLAGVSVTMLWALHNRAAEAARDDGAIVDPGSLRIHQAIDYDFYGDFGTPLGSLAARAARIDLALVTWLKRHPDGHVVSLGEGLETQVHRVDNGRMHWLSVDLPAAIRLRERFLPPDRRFRHIAASALDPVWMDAVDASAGVFIVAQGLLMYLEAEPVRQLFIRMADRFPGMEIVFDTVPRWFSHLTVRGLNQTASYRLPPMPWGIDRDEVEPTLRRWHPSVASVEMLGHRTPRGLPRLLGDIVTHIPLARHAVPSLVHVKIARAIGQQAPSSICAKQTASGLDDDSLPFKETPMPRILNVTDNSGPTSNEDTMENVLNVARQNAARGADIVAATAQVIARRVALGVAAAFDPLHANHVEFARMVPEKVKAFSTSGMVMLEQTRQATQQMMRFASDDAATVRAEIEITDYSSPAALAAAQGRLARACFSRAASSLVKMGMLALNVQAAAMEPIHATVVGNAERLGR